MKFIEKRMEKLVNYELTESFDADKNELMGLNYYIAKVNEDRKCYVKPESYIVLLDGDITLNARDKDGVINYDEKIHYDAITNGVIYITDYPYGFRMDSNIEGLDTIRLDFSHYDTSKITNMSYMFYSSFGLYELDVNNFDTSNVTDMSNMFNQCINLSIFDLRSFDTSNVTNMRTMFNNNQYATTYHLSSFDTSNVSDMNGMFYQNLKLETLNLSNFNTSKVTNIRSMFAECKKLTTLYLDNFDVSNFQTIIYAFSGCNSLNYIRCKQSFKDWCITNQDTIGLPTQMRDGGSGTWDIVG